MCRTAAILIASLAALCAGCTMGWSKPGATQESFNTDKYQCQQESVRMYPVLMGPNPYAFQAASGPKYTTDCSTNGSIDNNGGYSASYSGNTNCTTTEHAPPPPPPPIDVNSSARSGAVDSCLRAHGYEWHFSNNDSSATASSRVHKSDHCTPQQIRMDEC